MSRNLMLARYIYKKSQKNRSAAFCKCTPENVELCHCGENNSGLDWIWNDENCSDVSNLLVEGQNVMFHPTFSQGMIPVDVVVRF